MIWAGTTNQGFIRNGKRVLPTWLDNDESTYGIISTYMYEDLEE